MLKQLVKIQFAGILRKYTYDSKNNRPRSKGAVIAIATLIGLLIAGSLGAMVVFLALQLVGLSAIGYGWFYWALFGLTSLVLGVLGSVFSTYAGLYLAKDNDLLLSLPIPPGKIIASRILGVYLTGLIYTAIILVPAAVV